MLLTAKYIKIT